MTRNKNGFTVLKSKELFKRGFFRMRDDELQFPDGRVQPHYFVMDFSDWVNVVAVTDSGEIILVRQYRHGNEQQCLEIPGGSVDRATLQAHLGPDYELVGRDGRVVPVPESVAKQIAAETAARELTEETGYVARSVKLLGFHYPNPALQSNRLWTFLAEGCEKRVPQKLDPYEVIDVVLAPKASVLEMVRRGEIDHSLVIAGLFLAYDFCGNKMCSAHRHF